VSDPLEIKVSEILQGLVGALPRHRPGPHCAPQYRRHLQVDEVRCGELLSAHAVTRPRPVTGVIGEQHDEERRVGDDHR
jgi:hypothetical protein